MKKARSTDPSTVEILPQQCREAPNRCSNGSIADTHSIARTYLPAKHATRRVSTQQFWLAAHKSTSMFRSSRNSFDQFANSSIQRAVYAAS